MKRTVSVLLALALIAVFCATAWADYTDTSALSSAEQAALRELSDMKVVNGYPDGSFKPAATVSRAEFVKMICVYAGKSELTAAVSRFSDVSAADWFYGWVGRADAEEWVSGYPGGVFRPRNPVTQQEVATVLVRLSGADTTDFAWPDDYIEAARAAGAFQDFAFAGTEEASRILTCQMFYNMLPKQPDSLPAGEAVTVRGVVTELKDGSVTIIDGQGASKTYTAAANLLPDKLIRGAYLEMTVSGLSVTRVAESILPKKGTAYWDVALDGQSARIDDTKYNLAEAEIFAVEYTLNKPYSSETFIKGGPVDRAMLSLGGRLAAEMAVLVESESGSLLAAYLVNVSIIVSAGRLDVVDSAYSSAKGPGIYFLGRDAGLPMELSSSSPEPNPPAEGLFIHYTLKNGVINTWQRLLDIDGGIIYPTADVLKNAGASDPTDWLGTDGKPATVLAPFDDMDDYKAEVMSIASGRRSVQLGTGNINYWLADGCLVYEVSASNKIKQGSPGSIEKGQKVLALANRDGEICYMFCFLD
jgi:hypothetical protein